MHTVINSIKTRNTKILNIFALFSVFSGNAQNPHAFRGLNPKRLPVYWLANKKTWMTRKFYHTVLKRLNKKMKKEDRHIALLVDNAPSHDPDVEYSNIKVIHLPPNSTPETQPLDKGIIMASKRHYRKRQLRHILAKISDDSTDLTASEIMKSINVYNAIQWITEAVKAVKPSTIQKCFAACGVPTPNPNPTADSDDEGDIPLARLLDSTTRHLNIPSTTPEALLSMDDDCETQEDYSEGWEERRAELETPLPEEEPQEDEEPSQPEKLPSLREVLQSLKSAERYCLAKSESLADSMGDAYDQSLSNLSSIISLMEKAAAQSVGQKQAKIDSYFTKDPK